MINVIGFGSLKKELIAYTSLCGLSKHILNLLRYQIKLCLFYKTHIYVSLNRASNLSNANLNIYGDILPNQKK